VRERAEEAQASGFEEGPGFGHGGFGGFGVRRPLRFLAYKLELDREQTAQLAAILDDLKTERAQAAVDYRRSTSAIADALTGGTFDAAKVAEAGEARVKCADHLRKAVARALERVHALLDEEQRKKLAYYIRTGLIAI
jgi:Spy/CpxP family protein refolding chaperone